MAHIKVFTDSAGDLPLELARSIDVGVIALDVRIGGESLGETVSMDPEQFWDRAVLSRDLPETAAPSPGIFQEAFLSACQEGYDGVVCVTISSDLSATYQAARTAATLVSEQIPVEVVDSRAATMGEGLLVLEAAVLAKEDRDLESVSRQLQETVAQIETFGTLNTLDNLRRGGRIGGAQALLGSLLSIKPVVEVRGGVVEAESRQRTRGRSLEYLASKVRDAGPLKRLAVVHARATDIDTFVEMLSDVKPMNETIVTYIGPVIGTHTGLGTIGVCFQRTSSS